MSRKMTRVCTVYIRVNKVIDGRNLAKSAEDVSKKAKSSVVWTGNRT